MSALKHVGIFIHALPRSKHKQKRIMIVGKTNVSVWLWRVYKKIGQERFQDKLARCVRLQDENDVSTFCLEPAI